MKRLISLILALIMAFAICGCDGDTDETFSQEIVYEKIVVDENGNPISLDAVTSSNADTTDTPSTVTSSDNTSSAEEIKIDYNTTVEVDICNDIVRGYLDATTPARQFEWLNEYTTKSYDSQSLDLDWKLDASHEYTVTFSENADFSNAQIVKTKYSTIENCMLVPGKTYYWKVTGTWSDALLGGGKIYVKDAPVRWVKVDGVGNVRDMGGWKTESGKKVKYEMMYRGRLLGASDDSINVTEEGIKTIKALGWKTELDLRYVSQKYQTPGTGMNYVFIETPRQYHATLDEEPDVVKASYKKIFELLADESNYPFYSHCSAGADRTGTFAFITNGLLGVSYEDLTRDFELTSFSPSGKRWRADDANDTDGQMNYLDMAKQKTEGNTVAWGKLYNDMMEYGKKNGCTTLSQSIEYWLISYVGVPKAHIDSFKSIMLE